MLIKSIRCNKSLFNQVNFQPGFNVVLAERTKESTKKDSRNGLGKTTLIELIHFCLGANTNRKLKTHLGDWEFTLDLEVNNRDISVKRSLEAPSIILVEGDMPESYVKSKRKGELIELSTKEWTHILGSVLFGLPVKDVRKYTPTSRSLISYFVRRGRDAFSKPFEHHRKQLEWEKQVNNTFLLGLAWEDASDWQILKDRKKLLSDIKAASESGMVTEMFGSLGELQATKVRLENQARARNEGLKNYQVHPQYQEIQRRVDILTEQIHDSVNKNIADDKLLSYYVSSIESESESTAREIFSIYESVSIQLPELICRRLEEAENFHAQVISNRRDFLIDETENLRRNISTRTKSISKMSQERSELMQVLETHGALDEYLQLQKLYLKEVEDLNNISTQIENLRKLEEGKLELRIEQDLLRQRARHDYDERQSQREKAISIFNENSEALYNAPGSLVIDVGDTGFKFNVEIERSDSEGVSSMKVFCYDLMLAQLWSENEVSPGILIHDSTIFEGVDERQVALAIELAQRKSVEYGFQYICMLNSDRIPSSDFSPNFDLNPYVRLTLTDSQEFGSLLGTRF